MNKIASLAIRLSQITVEFGEEVGSRAVYAASVAAARIVLLAAETEAGISRPSTSGTVIAFPLSERSCASNTEENPPCSDE